MNDNNNQNLTQLTEWESKRDYRWNWMWGNLVAIFVNPVIWYIWMHWAKNAWSSPFDKLESVFGLVGILLGTLIWIILFFVCLIGWILARKEYNKFNKLSAEKDMEREREREREEVMNNPPILEQ
jgi:hypothetical protein